MIKVMSFGGGVQSSALMQMVWHGDLEAPDVFVFADTGYEPEAVYQHVAWCEAECQRRGLRFERVTAGNIKEDALRSAVRFRSPAEGEVIATQDDDDEERPTRSASLPYFTKAANGKMGIIRRQCTKDYKVDPVNLFIRRQLLGVAKHKHAPRESVEVWMGISTDELRRVTVSRDSWRVNRYPLVEKGMSRTDCVEYSRSKGHPDAPRSACKCCPFKSNREWLKMRIDTPDEWEDVCQFDEAIRHKGGHQGELFLHRSGIPLRMVPLTDEDVGQENLFRQECLGMCGV